MVNNTKNTEEQSVSIMNYLDLAENSVGGEEGILIKELVAVLKNRIKNQK